MILLRFFMTSGERLPSKTLRTAKNRKYKTTNEIWDQQPAVTDMQPAVTDMQPAATETGSGDFAIEK